MRRIIERSVTLLLFQVLLNAAIPATLQAGSDFYRQPGPFAVATATDEWNDSIRNRPVPVKIYYPRTGDGPFAVIIFSHGLGGSRAGYEYLGRQWASHGYVSVHLTHIGNDTSVLKQSSRPLEALRKAAADLNNALARPKDVSFAIDQLTDMNKREGPFKGRLALDKIGVAGHSFGGYTALASAGETFILSGEREITLGDPRIKAAIAMSAPAKRRENAWLDKTYGSIKIPCFHMTGTLDDSPIGETKAADRRIPFDHMSGADNYLLIFNGGDHMVFSGRLFKIAAREKDRRFQELILMGSTAFWDAYLKGDVPAKAWLSQGGFARALGNEGTLEKKLFRDDRRSAPQAFYETAKPYTRWWWFAATIEKQDVRDQLDWLKQNNFGGVEIAFVYPLKEDAPRQAWLSAEWSQIVSFAKTYADHIGLGCDFTFGTLWPFGDSRVPPQAGSLAYSETVSPLSMKRTWEQPLPGRVINHLDRKALEHYAARIGGALTGALSGTRSGLFCDSWEVETKWIWTPGFEKLFQSRYGYDIRPHMDTLLAPAQADILYDYFKLVSDRVLNEFYGPFSEISHQYNAFSRVQCGGAPADLLSAFSLADVPETEAILFEPDFARIPASAAALSSKPIVSSETFTCLYGWKGWPGPGPFQKQEQAADLKLVCDALFAHGVNQIIWHGMPFNPQGKSNMFYASVHVGPDSSFASEIPAFNAYMEKVSAGMRPGKTYSAVAVYLPLEDAWMAGEYPKELQFPWVWGQYELRYIRTPEALKGFQPLWINGHFLKKANLENGRLLSGDAAFSCLYVDVNYIDYEALQTILEIAQQGFPVCLARDPKEPGKNKHAEYPALIQELKSLVNVKNNISALLGQKPLLEGENLPDFWARETADAYHIFFSNPDAHNLKYPIAYGQSFRDHDIERSVVIHAFGKDIPVKLLFKPYQSIFLNVAGSGQVAFTDITFVPKIPKKQ